MLIIAIPVVGAAVALSYAALNARRRRHREILPTSYSERMRAARAIGRPTVSAVVPALNEEHGIGWVVEHIPSWVTEVVLVDGLSTDFTEALAQRIKPDLRVVHQHKRGKGAALRAGFAAAQAEIVVMLDADGSTDPAEIERFVDALVQGADFVKGSREVDGGGSEDFTLLRRAGNRGYVWLVNLLFGCRFTDLCYGYVAFWRRHVPALALTADGFEIETELVLRAVKAGLEIREVPSFELMRRAGKSNLHVFRDGWRVLRTVAKEWANPTARPGAPRPQVKLRATEKPAIDCDEWRPAGSDHRRRERRCASEYAGLDRRHGDRRRRPSKTTVVYVAESDNDGR